MISTQWAPVIINSEEEFNITTKLNSPTVCREVPLVGGSINVSSVLYYQTPELYFPNNSGKCKNTVAKHTVGTP